MGYNGQAEEVRMLGAREHERDALLASGDSAHRGTGFGACAAPRCVAMRAAVEALDVDNTDGHDHVPMNVDRTVRERLRRFLMRADVPRGMGYTAFLTWAIDTAGNGLAECETSEYAYCDTHAEYIRPGDEQCPVRLAFVSDFGR